MLAYSKFAFKYEIKQTLDDLSAKTAPKSELTIFSLLNI